MFMAGIALLIEPIFVLWIRGRRLLLTAVSFSLV